MAVWVSMADDFRVRFLLVALFRGRPGIGLLQALTSVQELTLTFVPEALLRSVLVFVAMLGCPL